MNRIAAFLTTVLFAAACVEAKPLNVFILAGQSNMEGPASISTFDYIGDDPATAPLLKMMRGADGKPAVCDGAWISYLIPATTVSAARRPLRLWATASPKPTWP